MIKRKRRFNWKINLFLKSGVLIVFLFGIYSLANCKQMDEVSSDAAKQEKVSALGKKVLFIIAPNDFRDEEYLYPREILEEEKINVSVASKSMDEACGMPGARVEPDLLLSEVEVDEYDGIVFIGGIGAKSYWNDKDALRICKEAVSEGKILAAICIAPIILAYAGVLEGVKATVLPSEKDRLVKSGAIYTGGKVKVDGKIITANGPNAAGDFGKKILEILRENPE
jgi:protease I